MLLRPILRARITGGGSVFGTLPAGVDAAGIVQRALVA
jgi:hypothetical protein